VALPKKEDYFFPGDWRNELRAWVKDNCLFPESYILRSDIAEERLIESVSIKLAGRKNDGIYCSEIEQNIRNCGKKGECQENTKTKERRFVGHYCNQRTYHVKCAERYRRGQGVESKNQFMEIVKAQDLWGVWSWVFTLPGHARSWIDQDQEGVKSKNFLKDCRLAVSKTIKTFLGVGKKERGNNPGYHILYHPVGTGDPFKQKSHFHAIILPVLANKKTGKIERFDKRVNIEKLKSIYKKELDRVFQKYCIPFDVNQLYVLNVSYVEKEIPGSINHAFIYNNRSQVLDVLKRIKRVTTRFEEAICLLYDKKRGVFIPCIKSEDELLDAFETILNPKIQIRMAYGFMRVLEQYSFLLGIVKDEFEESLDWVKIFDIEIRRIRKNVFIDGKIKKEIILLIRRSGTDLVHERISAKDLRGEYASMGKRRLFRAV